mmetsp:Transcript_20239/g.58059  ORF Transcript_20239/g.58059 Transcript_20239/m.58059 type:complete len:83 (+) Transcript_20239:77-325(+)
MGMDCGNYKSKHLMVRRVESLIKIDSIEHACKGVQSRQIDCSTKCLPSACFDLGQIFSKLGTAQFHNILPITVDHKPSFPRL